MVRSIVLLSGIVLALGLCRAVAAAAPHLVYPRPCCPNNGAPNAGVYGYFPTTWRAWPCEERPEITNPRSVGAETPSHAAGPGASAAAAGHGDAATAPDRARRRDSAGAGGGHSRTPGSRGSGDASGRAESGETGEPPPEGGLPGLPVEPDQPPTPGLPKAGATPLPSLDLNPPSQPAKETTKPSEAVPTAREAAAERREQAQGTTQAQDLPKPSSTNKSLPGARYREHAANHDDGRIV